MFMRSLERVDEFRREASNALCTKEQAITVTLRLLEEELSAPSNSAEDKKVLKAAMEHINFYYIDATKTETDTLLDSLKVARFTTEEIMKAIDTILFESQQ